MWPSPVNDKIVTGARIAQSVQRLITGWTFRDVIPLGAVFSAHVHRPWDPPSLLYNGYRVSFPWWRGRGVASNSHPHLAPRSQKENSYTLPSSGPSWPTLEWTLPLTHLAEINYCTHTHKQSNSSTTAVDHITLLRTAQMQYQNHYYS